MGIERPHTLGEAALYKRVASLGPNAHLKRAITLPNHRSGAVFGRRSVVDMGDNGTAVPTTLVASEEFRW